MFRRIVLVVPVLLVIASAVVPAVAEDCIGAFVRSVARDFKRRNCWPDPFLCPDRQAVGVPMAMMIERGWERQNMLWEQYFEPNTADLTEAGRLKVRWILEEVPTQHRTIYVRRADTPQLTVARLESVRAYATHLAQGQQIPAVLETTASPPGSPAERVDMVGRKFNACTPDPKLPSASQAGEGGQ